MSVREYIGARYVPLFSDPIEWDNTKSYEPLTVVKNQGASYVSRQSVPEGVEITNTQYWLLWADYNAQLEQYRQEVLAFDGRITDTEERITDAENDIDAIESDDWVTTQRIADANVTTAKIADANVTLPKLAAGIVNKPFKHSNIAFIGDSWLDGYTGGNPYYSYAEWFEDKFANVYRYAQGGAGFVVSAGTPAKNFYTLAQELITDHGTAQDIDYIFILGGVNDLSQDESYIKTGVANVVNALKAAFPYAKIYVASNTVKSPSYNGLMKSKAIATTASINGVIGVPDFSANFQYVSPWFTSDNYHLIEAGYKYVANSIYNILCGIDYPELIYSKDIKNDLTLVGATSINTALFTTINGICFMRLEVYSPNTLAANSTLANIPTWACPKPPTQLTIIDASVWSRLVQDSLYRMETLTLNQDGELKIQQPTTNFPYAIGQTVIISWDARNPYALDNFKWPSIANVPTNISNWS